MIRSFLILTLLLAASAIAQEISGVASFPMQPRKLTEILSFAVIEQQPENTLHWQITRDKANSSEGVDTITAGEGALSGESYAYYWDKEKSIFWFATVQTVTKMDLSDPASTKSVITSMPGFENIEGIPAAFQEDVKKILSKKNNPAPPDQER